MKRILMTSLLLLAACAPQSQPLNAPVQAPSIGQDSFHAADGSILSSRRWLSAKKPKAIIVALHGFNDYSNAFDSAGQYFSANGIATFAYDQRGFGQSPETGIWGGEDNFVHDLADYITVLKALYPRTPVYVLGESMGGAIAVAASGRPDFPAIDGVILSAPALWGGNTLNPLYRGILWSLAHTTPDKEFTGSDLKILASNNIPMLHKLGADPLVLKKTRADAIYGMMKLMDSAFKKEASVKAPILMMYGACDEIVPPMPVEAAAERMHSGVTFVFYPDGYHMLMRDTQGELVMADVKSWILSRAKPLPSGYGMAEIPADGGLKRGDCPMAKKYALALKNQPVEPISPFMRKHIKY